MCETERESVCVCACVCVRERESVCVFSLTHLPIEVAARASAGAAVGGAAPERAVRRRPAAPSPCTQHVFRHTLLDAISVKTDAGCLYYDSVCRNMREDGRMSPLLQLGMPQSEAPLLNAQCVVVRRPAAPGPCSSSRFEKNYFAELWSGFKQGGLVFKAHRLL